MRRAALFARSRVPRGGDARRPAAWRSLSSHCGLQSATLQVLNIVQTIPSIALFGILMVPLGYIAATVPFAFALGIRGHRRGAGAGGAVSLFAPARRRQHRCGARPGARRRGRCGAGHGHVATAAARPGRNAPGAADNPHRHPHRAGSESRSRHSGGADRRRWPGHVHLPGHRSDRDGSRAARRDSNRRHGIHRGGHPGCDHRPYRRRRA